MSLDAGIQKLIESGILGILLVFVGYAYWKKDQQVIKLNKEKFELAEKVFKIVEKFTELITKKQENK